MFGEIPAYGFFVRHVRGLQMHNVNLASLTADARPAFVITDAKQVELNRIDANAAPGVPTLVLQNAEDFSIQESRTLPSVRLKRVVRRQF